MSVTDSRELDSASSKSGDFLRGQPSPTVWVRSPQPRCLRSSRWGSKEETDMVDLEELEMADLGETETFDFEATDLEDGLYEDGLYEGGFDGEYNFESLDPEGYLYEGHDPEGTDLEWGAYETWGGYETSDLEADPFLGSLIRKASRTISRVVRRHWSRVPEAVGAAGRESRRRRHRWPDRSQYRDPDRRQGAA